MYVVRICVCVYMYIYMYVHSCACMFFSGRSVFVLLSGKGTERGAWQNSFSVEIPAYQVVAAPFDLQSQANFACS